jgi:hypothetical protein
MPDLDTMRQTPGEFRILEYHVPDFVGDFRQMDYGDPQSERLALLREEFRLDDVVAGCDSEWEQLLALKRWVRTRWNHGWSQCWGEVNDALDILRLAARGELFTCGFYGQVFVACCTALGFPARGISIGLADGEFPRDHTFWNVGHALPEAWSNDFGKWVVLDPDLNVYYEWEGEPLNALEIREAWLGGVATEVNVIQDQPEFTMPTGETIAYLRDYTGDPTWTEERVGRTLTRFGRHQAMDYYARLRINGWAWVDERCPPSLIHHFEPVAAAKYTANQADLYWTVNQVRAALAPAWDAGGARLQLTFEHCLPFFSHYEVSVDGRDWERSAEAFTWPMQEGLNAIEFRGVNVCGRTGPVARIVVAYASAQWA